MELITDLETLERIDSAADTLESNKQNLIRMIKEFEFCSWSEKKIIDAIENPVNTKFFQYDLSPISQRLFFKITDSDKKQLKEEIKLINEHYHNNWYKNYDEDPDKKLDKKIVIDTDSDKMKAIIGSSKYLVVSRNPVDIVLCSTNQNYGSCYSMDSSYGYAFGVPAIIPNKDIYVCFFTKGKHANYNISNSKHDYSFRYMKMLSRFFAFHCFDYKEGEGAGTINQSSGSKKDQLGIGYIYPKEAPFNMNHNDIRFNVIAQWFKKQRINVIIPDITSMSWKDSEVRYQMIDKTNGYRLKIAKDNNDSFFLADNCKGRSMNPYYDNINNLRSSEPKFKLFVGEYGSHQDLPENVSISPVDKIENERSWDDIYDEADGNYECCYDCDERISEEDIYYISRPDRCVCESCMNEHYFRCQECDDNFGDSYLVSISACDSSGNWHNTDICTRCFEQGNYYTCSNCNEMFEESDTQKIDDDIFCGCCFAGNTIDCEICGDTIHIDKTKRNYKKETVCNDCYKGKILNYSRTNSTQLLEFTIPKKLYFEVLSALKNNNKSLYFNKGGKLFEQYRDYKQAAKICWEEATTGNTAVETRQIKPVFEEDWWKAENITKVFKRTKINGRWFKTVITINWEGIN